MPIQTLGAGRSPHPGVKDEMKRRFCYSTSWRLYLGFATNIHKTKGRLGTSWNLGTSNSYSSCLFQVFRHMCKGFRADLQKLRPITSLHHFRDVACNREPRLLAVENLDAPAARTPCVGDQSALVTTLCVLSAPHKRPVLLRARPPQPTWSFGLCEVPGQYQLN